MCVFWFVLGSYIIFLLLLIDFIFSFLDKFKMGFGWFHTHTKTKGYVRERISGFLREKVVLVLESIKQNFLPLVLSNEVTPEFVL